MRPMTFALLLLPAAVFYLMRRQRSALRRCEAIADLQRWEGEGGAVHRSPWDFRL
jgi:hypothetical protein